MAQFFGLMNLNAANFDSGVAGDGEVLTADGAGGAAWEAAAGGGGAAFAFDGATFTPGTYTEYSAYREVTIELKLNGAPIPSGYLFTSVNVWCYSMAGNYWYGSGGVGRVKSASAGEGGTYHWKVSDGTPLVYPPEDDYPSKFLLKAADNKVSFSVILSQGGYSDENFWIGIELPSGAMLLSDAIVVPGQEGG